MLSSASDKVNLFAVNFSKNSNLDDYGISFPVFSSRTNLKLQNISVTPKMVEKVTTNLNLSKASGLDCIPVVVLKNYDPELSYILRPFQERRAIARARAHTRPKVFRRVINRTRK